MPRKSSEWLLRISDGDGHELIGEKRGPEAAHSAAEAVEQVGVAGERDGEVDPLDAVAGSLERLCERRPGEKVGVRPVEDAAIGVPPATAEQGEPDGPVGDVRRREYEAPAGAQERPEPGKCRSWVA